MALELLRIEFLQSLEQFSPLLFLALLVIKNARFTRIAYQACIFFVENDKLCTEVSVLTQSCEKSISCSIRLT